MYVETMMTKALRLLPCPSCKGQFPDSDQSCPYCGFEVELADGGASFIPRYRFCQNCQELTSYTGPCEHCGRVPEAKPTPKSSEPALKMTALNPVKPWDFIPNPLNKLFKEETLVWYGFQYDLRWSYLVIGVACFFMFRLFFALLLWGFGSLFHPFNLFSDLLHGLLVGGLVGMRGSGASSGAKVGALVSFYYCFFEDDSHRYLCVSWDNSVSAGSIGAGRTIRLGGLDGRIRGCRCQRRDYWRLYRLLYRTR